MSKIKEEGSGRIFQSPVLELLTRSTPLVSAGFYLAIIITLFTIGLQRELVSGWRVMAGIFVASLFAWTLFEYLFHRFAFHLDALFPESKIVARIDYALHGVHHEYPRDTSRLIMPPVPGAMIISVIFATFWLVMGEYVFVFLPGFLFGYLMYASVHYATHAWKPPKSPWLKALWRHHALHHYKHNDRAFGVSTPVGDYVFRTMPPERKKDQKPLEVEVEVEA